jgi:hypothetical protein
MRASARSTLSLIERADVTSVFQQRTGRWLEIRRVRFQAPRLRLVRRAERKQDEAETDGYLGNVG